MDDKRPGNPKDDAVDALALVSTVLAGTAASGGTAPQRPELLTALTALRELRDELATWEPPLIAAARAAGASWAELAPALGVSSRQAAERRFLRLQPSGAEDERTGEERVRDERDRRAGEKAVTAWARHNSGALRQLAGRISALEGLPAATQRHVDVVQDALGDDDASALLHPLEAAGSHLTSTHAELAEQIRSVTDQLDEVRRDSRSQRAAEDGRRTERAAGRLDRYAAGEPVAPVGWGNSRTGAETDAEVRT